MAPSGGQQLAVIFKGGCACIGPLVISGTSVVFQESTKQQPVRTEIDANAQLHATRLHLPPPKEPVKLRESRPASMAALMQQMRQMLDSFCPMLAPVAPGGRNRAVPSSRAIDPNVNIMLILLSMLTLLLMLIVPPCMASAKC